MKRSKKNIERNKLDYLLTDIMPVEVSELFSFSKFYEYLLSKQSTLDDIVSKMRAMKAENSETPFAGGKWGNWATSPLKFNILKGTDSIRGLNLVQPLSAMNIYFFVECYQKELLDILSNNSCFSLRYHRKNSDLFYRRKSKKIVDYFEKTSQKVDRAILQQTGAYFKIYKFNSVSSFTNSRLWQQCNFKYHNFAKIDYKSCFDSIYTHAYKWCIEKDTVDSKEASNANLHIVIDRVLQNINGRSSNGLIVGPEFSRMIAEVLLQEIDVEVKQNLAAQGLNAGTDYRVFRYVDDIYIFSHTQAHTDLHDMVDKKPLLKSGYISVDRIKDDFIYLVNEFPKEQRYIVSFMLSTLLNNISNKKDGYALFEPDKCARAFVLLDLAMYIYSFCPCFEHTQKLISMIVYMDDELHFSKDELNHKKLINLIRRYSFVFEKGNMNDLCNWFVFFHDYSVPLLRNTEAILEKKLREEDNPILWANYLIYSRYHSDYHKEILIWVEELLQYKVNQIGSKDPLLQKEFWYVITFINCPYISGSVKTALEGIVRPMATAAETNLANKIKKIIAEFLLQNKSNLFFCWGYYHFNTSKQLTFRTYQRTLFKQYKNKRSIELYGSLDT